MSTRAIVYWYAGIAVVVFVGMLSFLTLGHSRLEYDDDSEIAIALGMAIGWPLVAVTAIPLLTIKGIAELVRMAARKIHKRITKDTP